MLDALNPYRWLIAAVTAAALLGAAWWGLHRWQESLREEGRAEVRAAVVAEANAQRERNAELQRAAEKRYVVQAEVRERVITQTITEVHHAAAPLASCPVPADVVRMLNRAGRCAGEGGPAACEPGGPVPVAR